MFYNTKLSERHPERVFLREGSPRKWYISATTGDLSRKNMRSG